MPRVVLITGCRSGFGLGTAAAAARAGWVVYAGLRDPATADALRAATAGLPVHPVALDVTKADQRAAVVARIQAEQGRLDGLVNNAGQSLGGFLELVEEDELRALFEVNLLGAWALTKAALPLLRQSAPSTVVMVSSTSGLTALPGLGAYAASKFALEGLAEAWRHELGLFGVRMTLIEPGAYATDIFGRNRRISRGQDQPGPYAAWSAALLGAVDQTVARIARDPAEVATAIVGLLDHPRPPLRTPIGPGATLRSLARRLAPPRLVEFAVRQALHRARARVEADSPCGGPAAGPVSGGVARTERGQGGPDLVR